MTRAPSLAVVGSGPAAFYTIVRALQKRPDLRVDVFERQCVPYGLTRFGVAPDHPEVKNCQERFEEVTRSADFRFYGNCEVGKRVKLPDLAANFDAVLLSYGASGERKLGIPGEDGTPGVFSARHFVGWYNGEPEFRDLNIEPYLSRAKRATIIGNGNVALDVARMLLRDAKDLKHTDMSSAALEVLRHNNVQHVDIVGRRGLLHSAFTNKELRELQNEPETSMLPVDPLSELDVKATTRQDKRKLALLQKIEKRDDSQQSRQPKTWALRFLKSPREIVSGENGLKGVNWVNNVYEAEGSGRVKPTDSTEFEPTDLLFTSIGYKSLPIPGLKDLGINFDFSLGVVPRKRGKVVAAVDNIFASGWVATGPVGVIAATMMDSFAVGDEITSYLSTLHEFKSGRESLKISGAEPIVSWRDWEHVDAEEIRRGKLEDRPRSKFLTSAEVLDWLKAHN